MTSIISREKFFTVSQLTNYPVGRKGVAVCCSTGFMALCMWPFSPALAVYACVQRRYLNVIYKDDYDNYFDWREASRALVWPCAIVQHLTFLQNRRDDGLLRFSWEYDILTDLLIPKPSRQDKVVIMIGPSDAGKTQLFKKFVGVTLGTTRPGRHDTKLRIGVRPIRVNESEIVFLELWDVPQDELAVTIEEIASERVVVDSLLLVFDGSNIDSFEELRTLYRGIDTAVLDKLATFCVATKQDLVPANDRFVTTMGEEWARNEGFSFMTVSTLSSSDVAALVKLVTNSFQIQSQFPPENV